MGKHDELKVRLREASDYTNGTTTDAGSCSCALEMGLLTEAADAIEALEAENKRLREVIRLTHIWVCQHQIGKEFAWPEAIAAREALKGADHETGE